MDQSRHPDDLGETPPYFPPRLEPPYNERMVPISNVPLVTLDPSEFAMLIPTPEHLQILMPQGTMPSATFRPANDLVIGTKNYYHIL